MPTVSYRSFSHYCQPLAVRLLTADTRLANLATFVHPRRVFEASSICSSSLRSTPLELCTCPSSLPEDT
eukprot:IDg20105t1